MSQFSGFYRTLLGLAVLLLFIVTSPLSAQLNVGAVHGNVTDASGGLIPGVSVTATNTETGVVRTTVSGQTGFYSFEALVPGNYTIAAELSVSRNTNRPTWN